MTTRQRSTPSSAKTRCWSSPRFWAGVGVGGDGQSRLAVDPGDGPQDPLDAGGEALLVGGALQDARTHAGPGNTIFDIVEEVLVEDVHPARAGSRRAVVEVVGRSL